MSILSNAKAQMNRVYNGVKSAPVAKGIKGVLYEEGLVSKSQKKILDSINNNSLKEVDAMSKLYKPQKEYIEKNGIKGVKNVAGIDEHNMKQISDVGIDSLEEGDFKKFLNGRFKNNKSMRDYQGEVIVNKAKSNTIQSASSKIDKAKAKSFVEEAAREVDGRVALMTPLTMAKEYYGRPIANSIDNIKASDYKGALKNAGVAGARIGATATAGALAYGAVNVTGNAARRVTGNLTERGNE